MLTELEVDHSELNSLMQLAGVQGLHPPAPPSGPLMQNACPLRCSWCAASGTKY